MKFVKLLTARLLFITGCVACARFVRIAILRKHYIGILAYHHITPDAIGPVSPAATSPKFFSSHVAVLSLMFRIILMKDAAELFIKKTRLSQDALVFTFDDGYKDGFDHAAPLLEAKGVRGVFYVTGLALTETTILWNDLVGEALSIMGPHDIDDMVLDGGLQSLFKEIAVSRGKKRIKRMQKAFEMILDENQIDRNKICDHLDKILHEKKIPFSSGRALMNREQITCLANRGHEIGAHTLSHSRLSRAGRCAKNEITESVFLLQQNGIPVSSFAYPFGGNTDIDPSCIDHLKIAGISTAVTMEKDIVTESSDPYLLPRISVSPEHNADFLICQLEAKVWGRIIKSLWCSYKSKAGLKKAFRHPA